MPPRRWTCPPAAHLASLRHGDAGVRAGLPTGCRQQTMEVRSPTRCIRAAEGLDEATGAACRGCNPKRHIWEASGHIGLVRLAEAADYVDIRLTRMPRVIQASRSQAAPQGTGRRVRRGPQSLVAASQGEDTGVPGKETDALARAEGRRVVEIRLPDAHLATIDRDKITDYLLSSVSPRGRAKAGFFIRFGFSAARWEELAAALRRHAASHAVARVLETPYGPRYHIDGEIESPDGRNPLVRTVWQIDGDGDYPRFITAYPYRS